MAQTALLFPAATGAGALGRVREQVAVADTRGARAAFMLWMMGSGVHIMSIIFTFYQLITPIKGIMGIGQGTLPCLGSLGSEP